VICPKCGESNPDNFRFCGMCGAVLETSKTAAGPRAAAPRATAPKGEPRLSTEVPIALRIAANPPRESAAGERVPLSGGPSFLGLGQSAPSGPSLDTLRDKAFSGSTPTFVYEDPRPGRGRTLLLLFILAILVAGVWARYHYLGFGGRTAKPQPTQTGEKPAATPSDQQKQTTEASNVPPAQPATPPAAAPEKPLENTAKIAESTPKEEVASAKPAVQPTAPPAKQTAKSNVRPATQNKSAKPVAVAQTAADAAGAAAFRKGDAYLYGRGVAENCDEAIKNLKAASASGNAKARSAFGTMYATGHCVPRDLPTSYSWFALALRADPNNQILEKDLTAVWNQMTPPERQLATKIKQ
jgi:hypothetical protein